MALSLSSWNGAAFGQIKPAPTFRIRLGHGSLRPFILRVLRQTGIFDEKVNVEIKVTSSSFNKKDLRQFVLDIVNSYREGQKLLVAYSWQPDSDFVI